MSHKFNYSIAAPWREQKEPARGESPSLSVYTIHNNAVHYGTMEDAEASLQHLRRRLQQRIDSGEYRASYDPSPQDYQIYELRCVHRVP